MNTQLSLNVTKQSIYLNTDCIMILIDKQFLMKQTSHTVTHYMLLSILVWELNVIIHNSNQYTKINIYLTDIDSHTAVIICKIHIVNDLQAKMFMNIDVLVIKNIIMNLSQKLTVISSCTDIKISFIIITKSINQISKIILVKQCTIILSCSNLIITIIKLNLLNSHNFLFKSDCQQINTAVYIYIINYNSNVSLIVSQKSYIKQVNSCYFIITDDTILTLTFYWQFMH